MWSLTIYHADILFHHENWLNTVCGRNYLSLYFRNAGHRLRPWDSTLKRQQILRRALVLQPFCTVCGMDGRQVLVRKAGVAKKRVVFSREKVMDNENSKGNLGTPFSTIYKWSSPCIRFWNRGKFGEKLKEKLWNLENNLVKFWEKFGKMLREIWWNFENRSMKFWKKIDEILERIRWNFENTLVKSREKF